MTNNPETTKSNTPTLIAYQVNEVGEKEDKKSFWNRIGVAFSHADGKGFSLKLNAIPLDGRLVLRTNEGDRNPAA